MLSREISWRMARFLARTLTLAGVIVYAGLALFGCVAADRMIFQPQPASYDRLPGLRQVPAGDGTPLAVVSLPRPDARLTVFYFHGNAEDLGESLPLLQQLQSAGFAVLAFDYRGYGRSGGHPSESNVYADTRTVLEYARTNLGLKPEQLLVIGRSVGGGPAVELAAHTPVAGLVLISPFLSAFRVVTKVKLLPFDRFDNLAKIGRIHCPLLVIQGTADEVIPISHGQGLFAAASPPKRSDWIAGAGHNDIFEVAGDRIMRDIREFAQSLPVVAHP